MNGRQPLDGWGQTRRQATRLACGTVLAGLLIVGLIFLLERHSLGRRALSWRVLEGEGPAHVEMEFLAEGVTTPRPSEPNEARLKDDDEVIGVVAGGVARAYRLARLADRRGHVVNDLIGAVPVSVTYCDLSDCVRVFEGDPGAGPLAIATSGLFDSQMVLRLDGVDFLQHSGEVLRGSGPTPRLAPAHWERTTWRAWRDAHAETTLIE